MQPNEFTLYILMAIIMVVLLVATGHAAPETMGPKAEVFSTFKRKTDVPGLYTAPSLSQHFLRVTKPSEPSLYSRLFGSGEPLEPTALRISVIDVVRLPENVRYSVTGSREYLVSGSSRKGEATLTPVIETVLRGKGKGEAEAVITPETMLGRVEQKYYTRVGDHKVPIDTYKTVVVGEKPAVKPGFTTKKSIEAGEMRVQTEIYKPYERGVFKPSQIITNIRRTRGSDAAIDSSVVTPQSRKPYTLPSIKPYQPIERPQYTPIRRSFSTSSVSRITSSVVSTPSDPYTPPSSRPPESRTVGSIYSPLAPIIKYRKQKDGKKKRDKLAYTKMTGYEWFIENPIASFFSSLPEGKTSNSRMLGTIQIGGKK